MDATFSDLSLAATSSIEKVYPTFTSQITTYSESSTTLETAAVSKRAATLLSLRLRRTGPFLVCLGIEYSRD